MKRLAIATAFALALPSLAQAAEMSGYITHISADGKSVFIEGVGPFALGGGASSADFVIGNLVTITYDEAGGAMNATALVKKEQPPVNEATAPPTAPVVGR